jgi:chemotaxis protein histidine kinase CheA
MAGDNERALEAANDAYFVKKGQITDKYNKEDAAKSKAASDKTKADNKAAADALLKAQEEISAQILEWQNEDAAYEVALNEARLKQQEDYYKASESLVTDAKEKEMSALVAEYDALFELANGNAELEKELAEKQKKDIADIEEKYRKEKEDKDKEAAEKEKERLQKIEDFKKKSVEDSFALISNLTDLFNNGSEKSAKKAFQINKANSLAQAIVATYQNATKAYGSQLIIGDPSSVVRAQIAGGLALAGGLANIAKISKTQFNSSSAGGGGGGTGGGGSLGGGGGGGSMTSVTPAFNPLNTSFLNNRPAQTGAVQAYVLSSNVSSAMEANQKVKDQTVL